MKECSVRIRKADVRALRQRAKARGLGLSTYVRCVCNDAAAEVLRGEGTYFQPDVPGFAEKLLSFSLDAGSRQRIDKAAAALGVTFSQFVRGVCTADAKGAA